MIFRPTELPGVVRIACEPHEDARGLFARLYCPDEFAAAGIATMDLAREADTLLARFPNAAVNADEQRRLRAALYRPFLALDKDARGRCVDRIVTILLDAGNDEAG